MCAKCCARDRQRLHTPLSDATRSGLVPAGRQGVGHRQRMPTPANRLLTSGTLVGSQLMAANKVKDARSMRKTMHGGARCKPTSRSGDSHMGAHEQARQRNGCPDQQQLGLDPEAPMPSAHFEPSQRASAATFKALRGVPIRL